MTKNVKQLVMPYFEKLKNSPLNVRQATYLEIIQTNLDHILSSFAHNFSSLRFKKKEVTIHSGILEIVTAPIYTKG